MRKLSGISRSACSPSLCKPICKAAPFANKLELAYRLVQLSSSWPRTSCKTKDGRMQRTALGSGGKRSGSCCCESAHSGCKLLLPLGLELSFPLLHGCAIVTSQQTGMDLLARLTTDLVCGMAWHGPLCHVAALSALALRVKKQLRSAFLVGISTGK